MLCTVLNSPGSVPERPQESSSLPSGEILVHDGVAVPVGNVDIAGVRVDGCMGRIAEGFAAESARSSSLLAQCHQQSTVQRELANGMVGCVDAVERLVRPDGSAVSAREDALAPRVDDGAIAVEDDHGMLAAVEHVDVVVCVNGNRRGLLVRPAPPADLPNRRPIRRTCTRRRL